MMLSKINYYILLMIIVMSFFITGSDAHCSTTGYVFGANGDYILYNPADYSVVANGNLKNKLIDESDDLRIKNILQKTLFYNVFVDLSANRVFFSLGQGQENKLYGFLIYQLTDLKFKKFFEIDMALGPIGFLLNSDDHRLYISYVGGNETKGYQTITSIYDDQNYELLKKFNGQRLQFRIFPKGSCRIGERLYQAEGTVFNINTGQLIEDNKFGFPLICQEGYSLIFSSKNINDPVALSIYNLKETPISKKEIKTTIYVDGIRSDEWYVTKDGKFIIREEMKKGKGKTGNIFFFDVEKNKKNELRISRTSPYGLGILGFSHLGNLMFYSSQNTLYVIEIKTQKIIKEIQVPFTPIAVIWP